MAPEKNTGRHLKFIVLDDFDVILGASKNKPKE
jgi:hypothetical protein